MIMSQKVFKDEINLNDNINMHIIVNISLCKAAHLVLLIDHLHNTLRFRLRERCFFLWGLNGLFRCLLFKLLLIQV